MGGRDQNIQNSISYTFVYKINSITLLKTALA